MPKLREAGEDKLDHRAPARKLRPVDSSAEIVHQEVHVEFLVRELRKLIDVQVHCFGSPRSEPDVWAYPTPIALTEANAALQTVRPAAGKLPLIKLVAFWL